MANKLMFKEVGCGKKRIPYLSKPWAPGMSLPEKDWDWYMGLPRSVREPIVPMMPHGTTVHTPRRFGHG